MSDRLGLSGLGSSGFEKAKALGPAWQYKGPKLLVSGQPAVTAAARVMASSPGIVVSSNFGLVSLMPGTTWGGNKVLVQTQMMTVLWIADDRLYEWGTQNFINCEWMDSLAKGAERAQTARRLLRIEMELLRGLFAPFYLVLGASVAKSAVFYSDQKQNIELFKTNAHRLLEVMHAFEKSHPKLYKKLRNTGIQEFITSFPRGVTAEDVAFFVGRVIRGSVGAADALAIGQRLTIPAVLKIAGVFAVLVTLAHSPTIGAHAAEHVLRECMKDLKKIGANISFTEEELKEVAQDFQRDPGSKGSLIAAREALNAVAITLGKMVKAYERMN